MKQLDVDVSPPAFVWNLYLTLANVTSDLDRQDLWPQGRFPMTRTQTVSEIWIIVQ